MNHVDKHESFDPEALRRKASEIRTISAESPPDNANGEKVGVLVDQYLQPGTYSVTWDATAFPSGLYYYRLESGVWTKSETMMLQK